MISDAYILKALRAQPDGVSGADLARGMEVSRAAVWKAIEELRKLGYDIEATPHLGYRLVNSPDVLHADDLATRLDPSCLIGRDIRVFRETASTSDVVEKLARDNAREGVVVFAESQTRGRGRLGRKWSSPAGKGLWFSTLLRPGFSPRETTRLTVAAAVAMARAIESATQLKPDIKWPNDLLLGSRKVAGVLTELRAELDRVKYVIVGIGLDVNQTPSEFPSGLREMATSLRIEGGRKIDRASLAATVLRELDGTYALVRGGSFDALANEWEDRCTTLGHDVKIRVGSRLIEGRAESLNPDGALLVRTQHGRLEHVTGGDVTLEQ